MTTRFSPFTVLVLASILMATSRGSLAQSSPNQPAQTIQSHVDYQSPPATLGGLWAASDVVARLRVTGQSSRRFDLNANRSMPLIAHDTQVVELFKTDNTMTRPTHITVLQPGGTVEDNHGRTIKASVEGFDVYKPGEELILFLRSSPAAGGFMVAYGPAGSFVLDRNLVHIPVQVKTYPEFRGQDSVPIGELITSLRQLASASR